MAATTLFVFVCLLVTKVECFGQRRRCLPGENHKDSPSPEDSMHACRRYQKNACCTSEFTKQLADRPIRKIGNFSWTPCNNCLSQKCETFMVDVECFYRCSHNVIFWKNPYYPAALSRAPICANFCDAWFNACKDDLTCARNWITGFNMTSGSNKCMQPCRNFSEFFRNGKDLCESMWGSSFEYKQTDCLQLNFTAPNPNDELVEKLFGENGSKPLKSKP